jgi:hypothetical protein
MADQWEIDSTKMKGYNRNDLNFSNHPVITVYVSIRKGGLFVISENENSRIYRWREFI